MQVRELHPWDVSPEEVVIYQLKLAEKISLLPSYHHVRMIVSADAREFLSPLDRLISLSFR